MVTYTYSQIPEEELLVNLSKINGVTHIDKAVGRNKNKPLSYELRFVDLDCKDLVYDVAESMTGKGAGYPSSVSSVPLPITIDTTATDSHGRLRFSPYTVGGVRVWTQTISFDEWNFYILRHTIDPGSCTTGKIYWAK